MKSIKYLLALAVGLGIFIAPGAVRAANIEVQIVNIVDGSVYGTTGWVQCDGPVCYTSGYIGNYFFSSDIAVQVTNGGNPLLDLSYDAATETANAGTLELEAVATNYTNSLPGTELQANGNSSLNDTLSISDYLGTSNALCPSGVNSCSAADGTTLLTSLGSVSDALTGYSASGSGAGTSADPYSLGISIDINNPTGTGVASGDVQIEDPPPMNTPEPSLTLLLGLGMGLVALAAASGKLSLAA